MKVLFVSNDPTLFDPESVTRSRMRAYAEAIGTLHILSAAPVGIAPVTKENLSEDRTLTLHAVKATKFSRVAKLTKKAAEIIRTEHIEIVSAQDPFEHGKAAYNAAKGTSAKLHLQLHTDAFSPWFTNGNITFVSHIPVPTINRVRQKIADHILPKAHGIRVVSNRIHDSLTKRYGNRIVEPVVIPIAVSDILPEKVNLPAHTFSFALITVGRLEPEKRIRDIIHALAHVHVHYPTVGLFVVGDGSQRKKLENLSHRLGLQSAVIFLGNRNDALGLMQSANAYIQASAYEGYSRTLIEAALARIPIISTDVGIVGDVFKGYDDILSIPPGDPSGLAAHILGLVEDNEARIQFAMNAEQHARKHLASVHTAPEDIARDLQRLIAPSST